jgi:hypothetical protein
LIELTHTSHRSPQRTFLSELRDSYHSINERLATVLDKVSEEGGVSETLEDESATLMKELASGARKQVAIVLSLPLCLLLSLSLCHTQENEIIASMEELCRQLMKAKEEIAHHKNLLTRFIPSPLPSSS